MKVTRCVIVWKGTINQCKVCDCMAGDINQWDTINQCDCMAVDEDQPVKDIM